jgi:xanthine/uracil permease
MAIQTAYQRRKTLGKQVFFSVFGATVVVSFLLLSYFGFTFMENILLSCIVLMCAFGFALVSTASVSSKVSIPQTSLLSSTGYTAPTAFKQNSRLYGPKPRVKIDAALHTCKKCDQVMLAGINTCPKCGWYMPHYA